MTHLPHFIRSRWRIWVILPILTGLPIGCYGNIHGHIVSQNMTNIRVEPTDARSVRLDATQCYWWLNDDGNVNIAGKGTKKSLLTGKKQEFAITFVLGAPSQGVGKDYSVFRGNVRGHIKTEGNIYRFQNIYGIVGTENRDHNRIVAAYRCSVQIQGVQMLGGWSKPVLFLTYGTLDALPDRNGRGAAIQTTLRDSYFTKSASSPPPQNTPPAPTDFSLFDD